MTVSDFQESAQQRYMYRDVKNSLLVSVVQQAKVDSDEDRIKLQGLSAEKEDYLRESLRPLCCE